MSLITDWFRALDAVVDRELQSMRGVEQDDVENAGEIASLREEIDDLRDGLQRSDSEFHLASALKEDLEKDNTLLENKLHRIGSLLAQHGLGAEQCEAIKAIIAEPNTHAEGQLDQLDQLEKKPLWAR